MIPLQVSPAQDRRDPHVRNGGAGTALQCAVLSGSVVQRVRPHSRVSKVLTGHRAIVVEPRPLHHLEGIVAGQLEEWHTDALNVIAVDLGKVGNQFPLVVEFLHQEIYGRILPVAHCWCMTEQERQMQLEIKFPQDNYILSS